MSIRKVQPGSELANQKRVVVQTMPASQYENVRVMGPGGQIIQAGSLNSSHVVHGNQVIHTSSSHSLPGPSGLQSHSGPLVQPPSQRVLVAPTHIPGPANISRLVTALQQQESQESVSAAAGQHATPEEDPNVSGGSLGDIETSDLMMPDPNMEDILQAAVQVLQDQSDQELMGAVNNIPQQ